MYLLCLQLVNNFAQFNDLAKMDHVVGEVRALHERLLKADKDAGLYNSREALLGEPITDYSQVKKIIDQFDPFFQFWTTASAWKVCYLPSGRWILQWMFQKP